MSAPDSHSPKSSNHQHGIEAELVTAARRALHQGGDAVEPLQQLLHHYVCTAPQWAKASRVAARLVEVQESLHGPNSPELLPALGELATALSIYLSSATTTAAKQYFSALCASPSWRTAP